MLIAVVTGFVLAGLAVVAGCSGASERLNAPPQGESDRPSELQDNFVRMNDNAMLNERSMSSIHFVPGTNELNGFGARRLKRYATLLKVYGGPLHYDGVEEPQEMADARVNSIKQFLVDSGLGPDLVSVDVALAGASIMRASEATIVRDGTTATSDKSKAYVIEEHTRDVYTDEVKSERK
jgi:hypothetical protein